MLSTTRIGVTFAAAVALGSSAPALAQICSPRWHSMSDATGPNGPVYALVEWDPDGPGPSGPVSVAGGDFTAAVDVAAKRVAVWDGRRWHALGDGLDGRVRALCVWNGRLVAGGDFQSSGGVPAEGVAIWDGLRWAAPAPLQAGALVRALTVHEGDLIAAGHFPRAGAQTVNSIARFDGVLWHPFGAGFAEATQNSPIASLGVHNGVLYAGGPRMNSGGTLISALAKWDGARWQPEGLTSGAVVAIVSRDGLLYATGGTSQGMIETNLAFDGTTWRRLGFPVLGTLRVIHFHQGELHGAGGFSGIGIPPVNVARRHADGWTPLGEGIANTVHALASPGPNLIAGGEFLRAGEYSAQHLAIRTPEGWQPTGHGTNAMVSNLVEYRGEVIAAGDFRTIASEGIQGIARWNGDTWRSLGDGLASGTKHPIVRSLAVWGSALLAAGDFDRAGGQPVERLALWDGRSWHPFPTPPEARVLEVFAPGNELFASIDFRDNQGYIRYGPARWDGSQWVLPDRITYSQPHAMIEFRGRVVAAFSASEPGETIAGIATWDGVTWRQFGEGLSYRTGYGGVSDFAIYRGDLIAAGVFDRSGSTTLNNLARWDGAQWQAIPLPEPSNELRALTVQDDRLLLALQVWPSGQGRQILIYAWDGLTWERRGVLTRGSFYPDADVRALLTHTGDVYVGGEFTLIDNSVVSARIARLGCPVCYADCDHSTGPGVLDVFDFLCFQNRFAAGDTLACDCDVSTGTLVCDAFDFLCFQNAFAGGCP